MKRIRESIKYEDYTIGLLTQLLVDNGYEEEDHDRDIFLFINIKTNERFQFDFEKNYVFVDKMNAEYKVIYVNSFNLMDVYSVMEMFKEVSKRV
jgi:hypothetical protein